MASDLLAVAGSFCWNPDCADYAQIGKNNLVKNGHNCKGTQRLRCNTCGHTFAVTKGTLFYGRHHSIETILECLALLAERCSLAAIHRVKGVKEETLIDWLRQAGTHVAIVEALLLARYHLSRLQLDALWTYVGHKGQKGGTSQSPQAASSGAEPPLR